MTRARLALFGLALAVASLAPARQSSTGKAAPARTVTIDQPKITLAAALAELRKQSGVSVANDTGRQDQALALKLRNATFWQALDAIARAANARVSVGNGERGIALVKADAADRVPPTSYHGDYRMRLTKITASRDLDSDRSSLLATMEIAWAPAVRPLFLDTRVRGLRVLDANNKPLTLTEDGGSLAAIDGRASTTLDLSLPGVPRAMQDLAAIEGKLLVVAPSKMLTFRFDGDLKALQGALADGALRRLVQDEVTCRVGKIVAESDRWSVQVALDYPQGGRTLESFQAGSLVANNDLVLLSKDGKRRLMRTSYVIDAVSSRRALVTYHFRDAPARRLGALGDWRPVYTAPARVIDVEVPFTFKKVPLP